MTPDEKTICLEYLDDARNAIDSGKIKMLAMITIVDGGIPDFMTLGELNYEEALLMIGSLEALKKTYMDCIDNINKKSGH